jgi:hypothetical protein
MEGKKMMKRILVLALSLCLAVAFIGEASARGRRGGGYRIGGYGYSSRSVPVRSYVRRNGTFVIPHFRTSPNATIKDNWSTRPNINPFTGKMGTRNPFSAP